MDNLTLVRRAELYHESFPKFPPLYADKRWLSGLWVMGNNYKGSGYYGSYPPTYLKRIMSLFPDAEKVLHLFSGSLPAGNYTRFDVSGADVEGDVSHLEILMKTLHRKFDLILADPPYSVEDAEHYGKPLISRNETLKQCREILEPGGFIGWLDQVLPMFRKDELHLCGLIGMVRSTNHRFRVVSIFRRVE